MVIGTGVKYVEGTTSVYESKKARDFTEHGEYPIALELIFKNDQSGKELAANLRQAFAELPKQRGYLLPQECSPNDHTRCFEGIFKDANALGKVLTAAFGHDLAFYDAQKKAVVPKFELVRDAKAIAAGKDMAMAV